MSFISLIQKDLNRVLTIANQISPKKSDVEVFTFTKVVFSKDQVDFASINSNAFYKTTLKASNIDLKEETVEFLIKTDIFTSAVSLISDELVGLDLNLEKHTLIVQGSKSKHTLRVNTDELKNFSIPEQNSQLEAEVILKSVDFVEAVRASFISAGQPKNVYEAKFLNVCFTVDNSANKFTVVSTDRYRITKTQVSAEFTNLSEKVQGESTNFLLLPKNLQYLVSSLDSSEQITLKFTQDFLVTEFGGSSLVLRYGEGAYPDYEKIIPQTFSCSFLISTKDALEALKQVYLSARSNSVNKSITLKINPAEKKVIFSAEAEDGYASTSEAGIENYEGVMDEWSQSFNADYLIEYINTVKAEKILWESNPGKPSVLSVEGQRENQIYLVSGLK